MLKPYWQTPETCEASESLIFASPIRFPVDRTSARLKWRWGCGDRDLDLVDGDPVDDYPEAALARESWVHQECLDLATMIADFISYHCI